MFSKKTRKGQTIDSVVTYTFPKLHTGKEWYIDFKCYDPIEGVMKRKKYMLNSIPKIKDRRIRATELLATLHVKLAKGWSPWCEVKNERQYTLFADVVARYRMYLEKMYNRDSVKLKTYRGYLSKLKQLETFNLQTPTPIVYIYQLDQGFISDFLDYMLLEREASARTRNNYKGWCSSFCAFLVEKRFLESSPVEKIKSIKESAKTRDAISSADLVRLRSHLERTNRPFLLACMFEYYTFIRPGELSNIKIGDISIKDQRVLVPAAISKNRRDGAVALNDTLVKLMIDLGVFSHPSTHYLFGKDFTPSGTKASDENFRRCFNKVRAVLGLPKSYQFYSFKDSGIRDLANSEGIVVARDQARHTDISTTNKYLKGDSLTVHESSKHFVGDL